MCHGHVPAATGAEPRDPALTWEGTRGGCLSAPAPAHRLFPVAAADRACGPAPTDPRYTVHLYSILVFSSQRTPVLVSLLILREDHG